MCFQGKLCCSRDVLSFAFQPSLVLSHDYFNYQGYIPCSVPFPPTQHNFHVHSHLWPQLKFIKSHQCWGLLGWRPSQERNELIVTLRLLLSISELSTAVDRRCPGPRPSITGPHHQETKQITVSQLYSPESNQVQQNTQTRNMTQLQNKNRGLMLLLTDCYKGQKFSSV